MYEIGDFRSRFNIETPLYAQSVLGMVDEETAPKLMPKLRKRKNVRAGMVLILPCLCSGSILNDRCFCPAHRFLPIITRTVRPGAEIPPRYGKSNINRVVKAVFDKLEFSDSDRFTSKCFRRGCSNAMGDSDSALCQITRAAGRNADGYRSYLLLQQDEENLPLLLFER